MSRVGNQPIPIPAGITAKVDGNTFHAEGPKGKLAFEFRSEVKVDVNDTDVIVSRHKDDRFSKAFHGTTRALINNMINVLAGSLRDDGPLPDVITDIAEAQKEYKKVLKNASMVIMVSTMLHSIATGNMLPANVKVIVIDINQPTVTKLMDRGTWQALGIVSDVGAFLPMVANQIGGKK